MENQEQQMMDLERQQPSLFERLSNSTVLKLVILLILLLFMLIPLSWVNDLISERKNREQSMSAGVSSQWGGSQIISGPIIAIPYFKKYNSTYTNEKQETKTEVKIEKDFVFLLSNKQDLKGSINPTYLKRGIYRAVVYDAELKMQGDFNDFDLSKLDLTNDMLLWDQAKVYIGLSDLKGLKGTPVFKYLDQESSFQLYNSEVNLFENTLAANIDLSSMQTQMSYSISLDFRGSKSFTIFPTANETAIQLSGRWGDPSFTGGFLPEKRDVQSDTFTASWRIPNFSRKLAEQWKNDIGKLYTITDFDPNSPNYYTAEVSTGKSTEQDMVQINFLESVNNYQKTSRVAKYGILVILLTFTSLFFTEILKKRKVHIIQYVLIGCAMVVFYSLLLAISEHISFNWSYLLSGSATVLLVSSFIYGITKDKKTGLIFSTILSVFYGFIYFLLQLQDYALLVGTIGVFVIVGCMMRVSLCIEWHKFDNNKS